MYARAIKPKQRTNNDVNSYINPPKKRIAKNSAPPIMISQPTYSSAPIASQTSTSISGQQPKDQDDHKTHQKPINRHRRQPFHNTGPMRPVITTQVYQVEPEEEEDFR